MPRTLFIVYSGRDSIKEFVLRWMQGRLCSTLHWRLQLWESCVVRGAGHENVEKQCDMSEVWPVSPVSSSVSTWPCDMRDKQKLGNNLLNIFQSFVSRNTTNNLFFFTVFSSLEQFCPHSFPIIFILNISMATITEKIQNILRNISSRRETFPDLTERKSNNILR